MKILLYLLYSLFFFTSNKNNMEITRLLSLLWRGGLFSADNSTLYPRGDYEIVQRGLPTEGSSADFSGAQIIERSSGIRLYGGVRVDELSSHWRKRQSDSELESTILHIVAHRDIELLSPESPQLTLEIRPEPQILELYHRLPAICPNFWANMPQIERQETLSALLDQRVERKTNEALGILRSVDGDWQECCYIMLLRAFGTPSGNKEQFEAIARRFTYSSLCLHRLDREYLYAITLGLSGLLDTPEPDSYTEELIRAYREYQSASGMLPTASTWSKGKVRPSSHPAISLITAVTLLLSDEELFDSIFKAETLEELREILEVELPDYWQLHSSPSVAIGSSRRGIGGAKIEIIIINYILPLLFARSIVECEERYAARAMRLYEELPAEQYAKVQRWQSESWRSTSAFDSQALLQLSDSYCKESRCADCRIGSREIKRLWMEINGHR